MNPTKEKTPHVWRNFMRMIRQTKLPYLLMIFVFLLSFGESQIKLILPEKIAEITAVGAVTGNQVADTLIQLLMAAFFIGLLEIIVKNVIVYFNAITKARVHRGLQILSVDKLFALPLREIERKDPREFVSRITTDTGHCSDFFLDFFVNEPSRIYFIVMTLIKVFSLNDTGLILGALAIFPLSVLLAFILGRITFSSQNKYQGVIAQLTAKLSEKVNNTELIKAYGTEELEKQSGDTVIEKMRKAARRVALVSHTKSFIAGMSFLLTSSVFLIAGVSALLSGKITTPEFIYYITVSTMLRDYVTAHIQLWAYAKQAQGATARLSAVIELPPEKGGEDKSPVKGDISFNNVTFYHGNQKVLEDVSFTIEEGKKTALVGYSGSGKSTVLHLIEQFYRPDRGTVTVGGKDISQYDLEFYRSHLAYLPQNAPAFSGTVRDMLNYGAKESYTDEQLWKAIEAVTLGDTVNQLGGLDYEVGENAVKLSGGQRQKLCIARLLLSGGDYVLLDEATSALDKQAEKSLQRVIDSACVGKTQIVVAHSLETVLDAHKILVFDGGRLVAGGTHEELIKSCSVYQEIANQPKEDK